MKIAVLNGSPRKENTAAMVDAFKAGAEEAYFKQLTGFLGMQSCGVCKVVGEDNKKEEKMAEIKAFAEKL